MKVRIGYKSLDYPIEGDPYIGKNEVLSKEHDDLTARRIWSKEGYTISKFLPDGVYLQFHEGMEDLFRKCLRRAGVEIPEGFKMRRYHELVKNDQELHQKVMAQTKLLSSLDMPIHIAAIEEVVSEIVSIPLECRRSATGEKIFHFRVVRPGGPDFNPLHRDAWQADLKDTVNIYVPLTGSNSKSSLVLAPGSHLWPEHRLTRTREGAVMNGIRFNVPGLLKSELPLNLVRPNPGINQVMVFSPYLLHGGAANQNRNMTRVSFQMRFCRKKPK